MTRLEGPRWSAWTLDDDEQRHPRGQELDESGRLRVCSEVVCAIRREQARFLSPSWWRAWRWHRAGHPTETIPTPDYR